MRLYAEWQSHTHMCTVAHKNTYFLIEFLNYSLGEELLQVPKQVIQLTYDTITLTLIYVL